MAPEQALSSRMLDHRADVYSLGATLYELLALRPVFQSDDRRRLLKQIAMDEPALLRRIDPQIPADLEVIVQKAMAKDVDDRYLSAGDFADDLRLFLDDRPIKAKPPTQAQIVAKWIRRNPAITWVSSAMVALLMMSALFIAQRERQNSQQLQRLLAEQYLRTGQRTCDEGFVTKGLHWFALALEVVPHGDADLRAVIADNMTEWAKYGVSPTAIATHDNSIVLTSYSPDGTKLMTADMGGELKLWSAQSGDLLHKLKGHTESITSAEFSPDSRRVLSGSADKTARIWSVETGTALAILPLEGVVRTVGFRSHGETGPHSVNRRDSDMVYWII